MPRRLFVPVVPFLFVLFVLFVLLVPAAHRDAVAQSLPALDVDISGPREGLAGATLTWQGSVKPTPVGDVVFTWDFGDGASATGASVSHVYTTPGAYRFTCTASSASGAAVPNTETRTVTITTSASAPAALATALNVDMDGPDRARVGEPVPFAASAEGSDGATPDDLVFTWNFGDGSAEAAGATLTHVFTRHGVFVVTVVARSAANRRLADDETQRITILDDTVVAVTFHPQFRAEVRPVATYPAGWSLVSGAQGQRFPGAVGPLYTLADGGEGYEALPADSGITAGVAYWAYFARETTVVLTGQGYDFDILVAPGRYAMIGNPAPALPATVEGAAITYAWDTLAARYRAVDTLQPGQGAWVYPAAEAAIR